MFINKLNKREEPHVVKDEVILINKGSDSSRYGEKVLDHGNVIRGSIEIWSEPHRKGSKIDFTSITTDPESPWKLEVKVHSHIEKLFITYETYGDQVDGEDINKIQNKLVEIDTMFTKHKNNTAIHIQEYTVDGGEF